MPIDIRIIADWFDIDLSQLPKEENPPEEPKAPVDSSDCDETEPSK